MPNLYTAKGHSWIASMDDGVSRQRKLLSLLLDRVASDDMYRFLLVGCSLAREAGDELSDIDAETGIREELWPKGVNRVKEMVRGLGKVDDMLEHILPDERGRERRHIIAIFDGNLQLSLVVTPTSWVTGLKPNSVALYDPDKRLTRKWEPANKLTTPIQVREWTFLAWLDLTDAVKYLDRGSLWEALERLHRARNHAWQIWAVACKLDFATYGITQLLDDQAGLPAGIDNTVAILDADALLEACVSLANILEKTSQDASRIVPYDLPDGMMQTAKKRLAERD